MSSRVFMLGGALIGALSTALIEFVVIDGSVARPKRAAPRTVAAFGPGVVYLAAKDTAGAVQLERAAVR